MRRLRAGKLLLAALLIAGLLAGCAPGNTQSSSENVDLNLHCFSAGKADAFLLWTEDSAVLIDTGEKGFGKEILAYLQEQGIDKLDALIISHFDKDHVGGAAKILKNIEVGAVYQSNYPKDSSEYENYLEALELAEVTPVTVTSDTVLSIGGVSYAIDAPAQSEYAVDPSNNSSLIVTATDGSCRLLFMGDAEDARISEYLAQSAQSCSFLKVPYHGHRQEMLPELLEAVDPQIAVITSSDEIPEDIETVEALETAGARVLLTREAAWDLVCDGEQIKIVEE